MLSGLAAITNDSSTPTGVERPEQLPGARVSASFFDVLGVHARSAGRLPPAEDGRRGPAVAIVGRGYWTRRFGGTPRHRRDADAQRRAYTVVGALGIDLPPPFDDVDVWAHECRRDQRLSTPLINGGLGYLTAVARVAPGVRVDAGAGARSTPSRAVMRAPTRPTPTPIPTQA